MTCLAAELGHCQSTEGFPSARGGSSPHLWLYTVLPPSSEVTRGGPERYKMLFAFSTLFRCVMLQGDTLQGFQEHLCRVHSCSPPGSCGPPRQVSGPWGTHGLQQPWAAPRRTPTQAPCPGAQEPHCSSALSTHWSYTLLPPGWTWCKPTLQTHWKNKRAWETEMLASCRVTLPDLFGQGTSQASPLCPGALQRAELWSPLAPAVTLFISR